MKYRSWLIVPGNSDRLLSSSLASGADVLVADLEDSVPAELKRLARGNAAEWLSAHRQSILEGNATQRWVRINPMATSYWRDDLMTIMPSAPDGILLPKAEGPEAVRQLAAELYEIEERCGVPANSTRIIPLVGQTPRSAMTISDYLTSGHQRIAGLTWGAQDLAASISGTPCYRANSGWGDIFSFVRAQTLLTAHATGLMAVDTSFLDINDAKGLEQAARDSRGNGFTGMLAVHPDQVEAINQAFTPTGDEIQEARDIVAAFDAAPGTGSLEFNGRIIDKPQLRLARRMIGAAGNDTGYGAGGRSAILRPA